jgi:SAM-dependent methyltransferase
MYLQEEEEDSNPLAHYWLEGDSLAPPCQAELDVVQSILDLAAPYINPEDTFYDLGCGDGRICTEASRRFSCYSVGCEIEPHLIEKFRTNVELLKLSEKVTVVEGDLCELSLQKVGVISIYLLPESVEMIKDKLFDALQRGSVIICNTWGLKGLEPKSKTTCGFAGNCNLLLYDASCLT